MAAGDPAGRDGGKAMVGGGASGAQLVCPVGLDGIIRVYGALEFGPDGRPTLAWERKHLGLFELPYALDNDVIPGGHQVTHLYCHRLVGPIFQAVFTEIADAGLAEHAMGYGGCFNVRTQRGSATKLSTHAWGIALDLNPADNPRGGPDHQHPSVTAIFTRHGFVHGAAFPTPDAMHYQACAGY